MIDNFFFRSSSYVFQNDSNRSQGKFEFKIIEGRLLFEILGIKLLRESKFFLGFITKVAEKVCECVKSAFYSILKKEDHESNNLKTPKLETRNSEATL